MKSIPIEQFLETDYAKLTHNIEHTNHNSYTEIHSHFIVNYDFLHTNVHINKVLDIHDLCSLVNVTIDCVINVKESLFITDPTKLIPGTFIGKQLYDETYNINAILINGYITNYGVLS